MNITKVEFRPYEKKSLIGFADIEFDGELVVKGWTVYDGDKGLSVKGPSKPRKSSGNYSRGRGNYGSRGNDNEYDDVAFPITKEFREYIISEVEKELDKPREEKRERGGQDYRRREGNSEGRRRR